MLLVTAPQPVPQEQVLTTNVAQPREPAPPMNAVLSLVFAEQLLIIAARRTANSIMGPLAMPIRFLLVRTLLPSREIKSGLCFMARLGFTIVLRLEIWR
jgi:hypothetical protein